MSQKRNSGTVASPEPEQLDLLDWIAAQGTEPVLPQPEPTMAPAAAGIGGEPAPVLLTRVDPACNMRRFYSLALVQSLWGEAGVLRQWGRIGSQGQRRTDWHGETQEAERALDALLRAKRRRGYQP